mgnify:CR=1 FL=1
MLSIDDAKDHEYNDVRLFLMKENDDGSYDFIKGTIDAYKRDVYLEIENLLQGTYILVAELEQIYLGE